jgi:hypothetical protein
MNAKQIWGLKLAACPGAVLASPFLKTARKPIQREEKSSTVYLTGLARISR